MDRASTTPALHTLSSHAPRVHGVPCLVLDLPGKFQVQDRSCFSGCGLSGSRGSGTLFYRRFLCHGALPANDLESSPSPGGSASPHPILPDHTVCRWIESFPHMPPPAFHRWSMRRGPAFRVFRIAHHGRLDGSCVNGQRGRSCRRRSGNPSASGSCSRVRNDSRKYGVRGSGPGRGQS